MFGMGFFEILMVAVVAIIFLGPEKLPKALVDVAKFFKAVKKTMDDAKDSIEREVNLNKIKEEALAYKNSITQGVQTLSKDLELKDLNLDFDSEEAPTPPSDSARANHSHKTSNSTQTNDSKADTQDASTESQNLHSSPEIKKEITLNKQNKTTLGFGANLAKQEKAESQNSKE